MTCGCEGPPRPVDEDETPPPWWRDRVILLPLASGVLLVAGLAVGRGADGLGRAGVAAAVLVWGSLLVGASTFVSGAMRALFARRRLGIALLMTISAIGAVLLGHVEEAAALAFLYSLAEALEDKAMDHARDGLRALLRLVPETATVLDGAGGHIEIPAREIRRGQVLLVRPGERIPTDGVVVTGRSGLDTSTITGESIPVYVTPGVAVPAGAINSSGALEIRATAPGADNSLTTIVELVARAQAEKGARARIADRIARPLVPGVLVLAVLVGTIGSLLGDSEVWITRALVVLVAASPCAIAISVPVTVVSAIGAASRFGVVVTSGAAFERLARIRHVAVDKTGTLTRNRPTVTAVVAAADRDDATVLAHAAALEAHSTHPLAAAIVAAATTPPPPAHDVREDAGRGVSGVVAGRRVAIGSPLSVDTGALREPIAEWEAAGRTCVVVTIDGTVAGIIGIRDELRPEAAEAIAALRARGIGVSMLTGDNAPTAAALGREAGIDDVRAELRPEDKARIVAACAGRTPTAMIGDGINDAPALAAATVGIAMGATGSDAAIESADVAFTGHDLRLIPRALAHARRGGRIIDQNLVLSLAVIVLLPPLAITGVLGLAAVVLVHEVAEVVVIANGLRAAGTPR